MGLADWAGNLALRGASLSCLTGQARRICNVGYFVVTPGDKLLPDFFLWRPGDCRLIGVAVAAFIVEATERRNRRPR